MLQQLTTPELAVNTVLMPRYAAAHTRALETPELLGQILNNCGRLELEVACTVSRHWSAIVGAFTHFGTFVVYNPRLSAGVSALSRCLNRGGQRRVFICIPWMTSLRRASIVEVLGQHASRIRGLSVGQLCSVDLEHVWGLVRRGMPMMQELVLQGATEHDEHCMPVLFTLPSLLNSAPQLLRLLCSGVNIDGCHEDAKKLNIIEFVSMRSDGTSTAQSLWQAPWKTGATVVGLAIRENARGETLESWIVTAWAGRIHDIDMAEEQLTGTAPQTFIAPEERTKYRRIVLDESLRRMAFSDNLTTVSMPLYFWGLARTELGGVTLPNLRVLHLLLVELDDDSAGEGSLICPMLQNVGLQVHKLDGKVEDDNLWDYFIPCTYQDMETFLERTIQGIGRVVIDLFPDGFHLSGERARDDLQFRAVRGAATFQSWVRAVS